MMVENAKPSQNTRLFPGENGRFKLLKNDLPMLNVQWFI
jgi:hypothetical protein